MNWKPNLRLSRRNALTLSGTALASSAFGLALGYKFRHPLHDMWRATMAEGLLDTPGANAFAAERARILGLRRQQTEEKAAALKQKYAEPVFGPMAMWQLVEKLSLCIDSTDMQLFAVSQLVHVKQVIAAMEREGITDPYLYLIALLHDVGKVALLSGGSAEHFLGPELRLSDGERAASLDNISYEFGHAGFIHTRIKDYVPEPVAWTIRYHNIDLDDAIPFMTDREREYVELYLRPFRRFDNGFKSYNYAPSIDMTSYQELIREYFPEPILF